MNEIIIEFGNDALGESRIYQKNLKGYEQAIKDMKLYKAQQNHKIAVLERALELACETFCSGSHPEMRFEIEKFTLIKGVQNYFKAKAESDIKNDKE